MSGRSADERGAMPRSLAAAFALLFALTLLYAAWPVWRAFLPLQIDVNEAWNAWHADAWRNGGALYPDPTGLVINNYPPLSFWLLGTISKSGLDAVYAGRILSFAGLLAICGAIGCLIRHFGGGRAAVFLGAVWFCATIVRFFDLYAGMNDPELPSLAIMALGLVWLLRRQAHGQSPDPAILLIAAGGFYKNAHFVIPILAIAWLALTDRRAALRAALIGAGGAALGLALCSAIYGPVFLQSLTSERAMSLARAFRHLAGLHWIAPALAIGLLWIWRDWKKPAARFCALFIALGFVFHFLLRLGEGVDDNAQVELILAAAVTLGLAFDNAAMLPGAARLGAAHIRLAIVVILILRLLLAWRVAPYQLVMSPAFRDALRADAAVSRAEVARIAAIPGPVHCDIFLVCRWAGKPFLYDELPAWVRGGPGRRTEAEVERKRDALGARFETIDPRAKAPNQR